MLSVFATLPLGVHAADIEPIEYTWIEDSAPGQQAMVSFSLAGTYFDMDVTNGFAGGIFGGFPAPFIRQPDDGFSFESWGITGDIEAWLPTAATGYFVGGLEGAWVEDDQSSEIVMGTGPLEFLDPLPISGGEGLDLVALGPDPVEVSADSQFYRVAGLAGLGTNVANGTKVGVGAYVAYSELDLDARYQNLTVDEQFSQIDETVETWSGGLALLGESRHEVMPGFGVFIKGRAAALYANGELDASQNGNTIDGPFSRSVDNSQDEFAGLVEGQFGLDVAIGPNAKISIFGGASWRNDVFEIVNPRAGLDDALTTTTFAAAHLEQTDLIEYSAGGEIEFNW